MIAEAPSKITHRQVAHKFVRDRMIWQFYILAGLCSFVASSLGPLMPFLRSELKFNYTITAYHFSAFALGVLISGTFGDKVLDLLGRKKALWAGLAGVASGVAILILGKAAAITISGIFLAGLCASIFGQVVDTVIAEKLGENRTIAITETNIVTSLCATIAPAAIGIFVSRGFDWRTPLVVLIIFFGMAYRLFNRNPIPESDANTNPASSPNLHADPSQQNRFATPSSNLDKTYWAYWFVILLGCASEWSIIFWSPDFLQHAARMEKAAAATAVSAFSVAMMAGRISGSLLSRRISVQRLLPTAAILSLIGFLTFWLAPSAAINVLGLFIAGLGVANMYPLTLSAALGAAPKHLGIAASRINMATGLAGLCAPLVLGGIADRAGIYNAYSVVAIMLSVAVVAVGFANKLAGTKHLRDC